MLCDCLLPVIVLNNRMLKIKFSFFAKTNGKIILIFNKNIYSISYITFINHREHDMKLISNVNTIWFRDHLPTAWQDFFGEYVRRKSSAAPRSRPNTSLKKKRKTMEATIRLHQQSTV